ncbi:MAG: HNH endonuclease signature motif containing protein [Pirellulales bacterium]
MEASVRQFVRERAGFRCEYCKLSQFEGVTIQFHIEHIRPRQHGGDDSIQNLALACSNCNWYKGPNLSAIDPQTDLTTRLYHPRVDLWRNHFTLDELEIMGLTDIGRATVRLLRMNAPEPIEFRESLRARGELNLDD